MAQCAGFGTIRQLSIGRGLMFELPAPFEPLGDQPQAMAKPTEDVLSGARRQKRWASPAFQDIQTSPCRFGAEPRERT